MESLGTGFTTIRALIRGGFSHCRECLRPVQKRKRPARARRPPAIAGFDDDCTDRQEQATVSVQTTRLRVAPSNWASRSSFGGSQMQDYGVAMKCPICMHIMETNGLVQSDRPDLPDE